MTDKVQKIREEVARIQLYTQSEVLKQVLDYIDEVQKEPVSIWHDGCEIPESETNILMLRKDVKDSNYPPIAGCFYGTNSRLDGRNWGYYNGFCYNEIEPPIKWAYIDDILNLSNVQRTVKNWEEPVSEDLGEYINELSKQFPEVSFAKLSRIAVRVAKWQKKHLWKPADGDDLPEYDREVVVFTQNFPNHAGIMSVAIGHRPNPDGWDGKSLSTGKVEHYTPKTYDKGGWNIPDIVYWLDVELPKEIEL